MIRVILTKDKTTVTGHSFNECCARVTSILDTLQIVYDLRHEYYSGLTILYHEKLKEKDLLKIYHLFSELKRLYHSSIEIEEHLDFKNLLERNKKGDK